MAAAIFVLLAGTAACLLGLRPLLTGKMEIGLKGSGLAAKLTNIWTAGTWNSYSMRPLTARFVGLMLVALGVFSVIQSASTLLSMR